MTGFENFDIRAWLVDGLTKHVSSPSKQRQQAKQSSLRSQLVLPVILAGIAASAIPYNTVSACTGVEWFAPGYPSDLDSTLGRTNSEVAKYWTARIAEVLSWRELQEADHSEPPELF